MKLRHSVPALTLTLALASQPVLAQGHRGGGSRGGHGGGSHSGSAVARHPSAGPRSGAVGGMHYGSRPGYAPRGSVAAQRHPRAGTGYGYGYHPGHGYYRGGHSYYRPYYGYRPYYPYYPYYSSYWPGVSLSFGWGYGSNWPYYVGGYYGSPGYSVGVYAPYVGAGGDESGAPPPRARDAERSYEGRSGRVRLEVRPDDTSVYVDDEFRGTAREARIMNLPPGRHLIELVRPGFAIERREVTVVSGESQDALVELLRP
jgi:PEGA domain